MHDLVDYSIFCPYCGEPGEIFIDTSFIDTSESWQELVEDCQVCCRPIHFRIRVDETLSVEVEYRQENEC